ncbi:hypothetical protein ACMTAU_02615, partial [Alcaligenes pakistanensis]
MVARRASSVPDSSVPTQAGLLLHPQWLDYPRLEGVARQIAKKARYQDRAGIRRVWLKAWRLPQDAAFFNQIITAELGLKDADQRLESQGVPEVVIRTLRLLYQMSADKLDADIYEVLREQLLEQRGQLAGAIASQSLPLSENWPEGERGPRLLALVQAWQSLPLAQTYLWQLQAEQRDRDQRSQRWEQAQKEREQARQKEQSDKQRKFDQAQERLTAWLQEQGCEPQRITLEAFEGLQAGEPAHWFMTVYGRNASA